MVQRGRKSPNLTVIPKIPGQGRRRSGAVSSTLCRRTGSARKINHSCAACVEIDQNQRSSRVLVDAPDDDAVSEHIVSPSHNSPDGREADARLRMSGILEKPHPS
jgi:hypothetical protein